MVASNSEPYAADGLGTEALETLTSSRTYHRWVASFFAPFLGKRNFEVGAGIGDITEMVAEVAPAVPFEIETRFHRQLALRFAGHPNVEAVRHDILACDEWNSVDCIYSANVLEHVDDDIHMIRHCARLLVPGGRFVAFVPAGRWLYSEFDRSLGHVRRYSDADRHRIRESARLGDLATLEQFRYVNLPGAFGWFIFKRCLRQVRISAGDLRMAEAFMPLVRLTDRLRLPFGQSAVLVVRRNP